MFGFDMMGSYESRKVGRYDGEDGFMVSTAMVTDGDHPYETAVAHPAYNSGKIVIVAAYDSKDDARDGHDEWVERMTADKLPDQLVEVENSEIGKWAGVDGRIFPRGA